MATQEATREKLKDVMHAESGRLWDVRALFSAIQSHARSLHCEGRTSQDIEQWRSDISRLATIGEELVDGVQTVFNDYI